MTWWIWPSGEHKLIIIFGGLQKTRGDLGLLEALSGKLPSRMQILQLILQRLAIYTRLLQWRCQKWRKMPFHYRIDETQFWKLETFQFWDLMLCTEMLILVFIRAYGERNLPFYRGVLGASIDVCILCPSSLQLQQMDNNPMYVT